MQKAALDQCTCPLVPLVGASGADYVAFALTQRQACCAWHGNAVLVNCISHVAPVGIPTSVP